MAGPGDAAIDSSRAGVTRVGGDATSVTVAQRVPTSHQVYTVVAHGNETGFAGASTQEVIDAVAPHFGGDPICLFSCFAANNGTAQALSDAFGVVVRAPTSRVGLPRFGPAIPALDGGSWMSFFPGSG
jgi:hypothetical protein